MFQVGTISRKDRDRMDGNYIAKSEDILAKLEILRDYTLEPLRTQEEKI